MKAWARFAFGMGIVLPTMIYANDASTWWFLLAGAFLMIGAQYGWTDE